MGEPPEKPDSPKGFEKYRDPLLPDSREFYLCENRKARDSLSREICETNNNFMAAAMKSAESFRELLKHTEGMKFKNKKAVVLYPGSGFHVAPIAEMGEELLRKHNLDEVEFVYTEIGGEPMLRSLQQALEWLVKRKEGWSTAGDYRFESDIETEGMIAANGGAFEHIFEIETPRGRIVIRFKNALSGEEYYLDDDLQRANIVVLHDITYKRRYNEINKILEGRKDRENLLIISEGANLESSGKRKLREPHKSITFPVDISTLPFPYGCSVDFYQERKPILLDKKTGESIDLGETGLIDPNILALTAYGFQLKIDPQKRQVAVVNAVIDDVINSYGGILYPESEVAIMKSKQWLSNFTISTRAHKDLTFSEAEEILFKRVCALLRDTTITKEKIQFRIARVLRREGDKNFYLEHFVVPKHLYSPVLFQLADNKPATIGMKESPQHETEKPHYGAIIVRPKKQL